MAKLRPADLGGFGVMATVAATWVWMLFRGRTPAVAAVGALTVVAAILVPLYVLVALWNRPKGKKFRNRGPDRDGAAGSEQGEGPGGEWHAERTFGRAKEARERGELWRAKEILQGTLASQPYHPELYEWYGRVLVEMGDLLDAGKYLFLSGRRDPAYREPISIFLTRFKDKDAGELIRVLPARARDVSRLPSTVIEELEHMGWKPHELRAAGSRSSAAVQSSWMEAAALTLAVLVFVAVLILGFTELLDLVGRVWPA